MMLIIVGERQVHRTDNKLKINSHGDKSYEESKTDYCNKTDMEVEKKQLRINDQGRPLCEEVTVGASY